MKEIITKIIVIVMVIKGAYHGIIEHDYPHACFDLLIALLIKTNKTW
jgi:hypothetical protein